jgi:hypothetical protein
MREIHVDNIFSALRRLSIDLNFENGSNQAVATSLKGISR